MTFFDKAVLHIARLGPAGLFPNAPGTAGSFAAVMLAPFIYLPLALPWRIAMLIFLFAAGALAATKAEILLGRQDPGCVVIDELVGQWISMLFLKNPSTGWDIIFLLVPFFFFRFFDILKPWPVHASEEWLPAGWGIMIDDVLAGLWALLCVSAVCAIIHALLPGTITL